MKIGVLGSGIVGQVDEIHPAPPSIPPLDVPHRERRASDRRSPRSRTRLPPPRTPMAANERASAHEVLAGV